MKIDKNCLELIGELSMARGPSGFEDEVIEVVRRRAGDFCDINEDCLRNLYLYPKKGMDPMLPTLMLDAHSDEVGFMVQAIKPNGTMEFVRIGSMDPNSLQATRVRVRDRHGRWVPGMIAAKPPHFITEAERGKAPAVENMVIDIGARSAKEAAEDFGMRIGEPAVPDSEFYWDPEHEIMIGKAFDCRIGCAALIEALRRIQEQVTEINVVGVLSSQEEVGERGCAVAVRQVSPDIAIVFEGCPADDTFTPDYAVQTALKKGPMLRFRDSTIICSPRFQRFSLDLAESRGIAAQCAVRRGGGNNGGVINTSLDGIPVVVSGIPVRYIHAQQGIASYFDFESAVQLAVETAKSLSAEVIKGF